MTASNLAPSDKKPAQSSRIAMRALRDHWRNSFAMTQCLVGRMSREPIFRVEPVDLAGRVRSHALVRARVLTCDFNSASMKVAAADRSTSTR